LPADLILGPVYDRNLKVGDQIQFNHPASRRLAAHRRAEPGRPRSEAARSGWQ
jgi:hypothetical protein